MSEWIKLTKDLTSHPSHKDFVIVRLKVGCIEMGCDYLYDEFSKEDGWILNQDDIDSWRLMTDDEKAKWCGE